MLAGNGVDTTAGMQEQLPRMSAGLKTAIGVKSGNRARIFGAVRRDQATIPGRSAKKVN